MEPSASGAQASAIVSVVVGTRPEVVKMAPVVRALREAPEAPVVDVCVVGQQREVLDAALHEWQLDAAHRFDVAPGARRAAATLAAVLAGVDGYLQARAPGMVLVHGDTASAVGAALAAFYAGVPVGHVEAGLRTGNRGRPFPEEMHRGVVDRVASVHYAPTGRARENLLREGCDPGSVVLVGNTVVDALYAARPGLRTVPHEKSARAGGRLLLVTCHRRENFGEPARRVCEAVRTLVRMRDDLEAVYVLHPNPSARAPALTVLAHEPRVRLVEPMGYAPFVSLLESAYLVLTDSGGVQEEAPYLGVPVLVARDETERPEGLDAGGARIVGTVHDTIVRAVTEVLDEPERYAAMVRRARPFGDGLAARRIADDLLTRLGLRGCA